MSKEMDIIKTDDLAEGIQEAAASIATHCYMDDLEKGRLADQPTDDPAFIQAYAAGVTAVVWRVLTGVLQIHCRRMKPEQETKSP